MNNKHRSTPTHCEFRARRASIESIERRLLLSTVTVSDDGTIASVAGTDAADTIDVFDGTTGFRDEVYYISVSGRNFFGAELSSLQRIEIRAGDGDDLVNCSMQEFSKPVFIDLGEGNDRVEGDDTRGIITADGGEGNDTIIGGAGADRISGGLGSDRLYGRGGRDRLSGGGGKDRLYGGASGDWLSGQGGDDQLFGEGGNDRLSGGVGGRDTLHGNAGDDYLASNDGSIDELFGDGGTDSATADLNDILSSIETTV